MRMISCKNTKRLIYTIIRQYANSSKPKIKLDEEVNLNINNAVFKPKHHPGRIKTPNIAVPQNIIMAIEAVVEDYPIKSLIRHGIVLAKHLHGRLPPIEKNEYMKIRRETIREVINQTPPVESNTEKDQEAFKQTIKDRVQNQLRHTIYNWKPINYNDYNSLVYVFARFAPDYAVLLRVFSEIYSRDANFKPKSLFDFGSGTGTATWAANFYWKANIFEYFNVDSSGEMNDLAQFLLHGRRGDRPGILKGHYYRQFLPATHIPYDLVVSAFSLMELPSLKARLQTIENLWNKTTHYLVIIEQGTNAGFKIVNEARDFILNIEDETNTGHVFSPCPHDLICPRFVVDSAPCNFAASYYSLPFGGPSTLKTALYSYVVLKKGKRETNDPQWPRLVQPPLLRSKHAICRMCCANGKLDEAIFTASKHGKVTYYCARSSEWGDLLPVQIQTDDSKNNDP